jgi:ribose-phosphate pyrophosphokinase
MKSIISPILNAQKYTSVTVFDPHSDVAEACLDNYIKIDNETLVSFALDDININGPITVISPDAGALKKIYNICSTFNLPDLLIGSKVRDIDGKILHTSIDGISSCENKNFIIIDDICDGGRTFIELVKTVKKQIPDAKVHLVVSHGIFSKGLYELSKLVDTIYTTNSIRELHTESFSDYTVDESFVKILSII